ncbi:hypothetical protein F5Y08DRAFT_338844 [Xylaria arbuscula]|uniref:RRM domain-containing protein n=1 Tax=Xylaria arbuscula TaxID=114810 RepID=A0A9W8NP38_9PEZI|nr:hypothetical protein F5Y08DRAFT_338844 [Xylaria arbuscula]KAJ3579913.1 hypothetical protein NPX13_g653 [Xylaria arbuscula]
MSLHGFVGQPPFRAASQNTASTFDHDVNNQPVGTSYPGRLPPARQVIIHRLSSSTTEENLRMMFLFSQELVNVEMLPQDMVRDRGFRSAVAKFKTLAGAQQAKDMLHGKSVGPNEPELVVEIISGSPTGFRGYPEAGARRWNPSEDGLSTEANGSSSVTAPGPPRQPTRFGEPFPSNENSTDYYHIFSPHSPIGNHLTNQTQSLGKTLIHDTAEDDETRELLKDPVAYAENGAIQQRRATAPQLPIQRLSNLSLNTATNGNGTMAPYGHSGMTPMSAHPNNMSPTIMNGANHPGTFGINHNNGRLTYPQSNPADQNPPCNTLYVGNLPIDTSEEELKAIFQKQRGYKRLCFRTKQNGPMCFVEFEDITFATKTLNELYGLMLHNSVKGGIRLSFSKNPLGVRSGQATGPPVNGTMGNLNAMMAAPGNSYSITSGPPPGLSTPPGLTRVDYSNPNSSNSVIQPSSGTNTPSAYPPNNNYRWNPLYAAQHSTASSSSPPSRANGSNGVNGSNGPSESDDSSRGLPTYMPFMAAKR